jgi:hypothetical protein
MAGTRDQSAASVAISSPLSSNEKIAMSSVKGVQIAGLAQMLGQLQASDRDFQSNCWASLKLWANPVNFTFDVRRVVRRRHHRNPLLHQPPQGDLRRGDAVPLADRGHGGVLEDVQPLPGPKPPFWAVKQKCAPIQKPHTKLIFIGKH